MINRTSLPPQLVAALVKGLEAESARSRVTKLPAMDPSADSVLDQTRLRAAVVGSFDPETIVPAGVPDDVRATVQRRLANESDDVSDPKRRRWTLQGGPRRQALASVRGSAVLATLIGQVPLDPDDRFGAVLQRLLSGKLPDLNKLSTAELQLVHRAGEFAALARPDSGLDLEAVRARLGRRSLEETVDSVLPNGLIGRKTELANLIAFTAPTAAMTALEPKVVTGIGGSGKSTLIAALVHSLRQSTPPIPVILLDFDRPMVTAERVGGLTIELAQQFALQVPALSAELARFCAEAANRTAVGYSENAPSAAVQSIRGSLDRGELVGLSELGQIAAQGKVQDRPLVVVLDTFEEVVVQGSAAVAAVRTWFGSLASTAGFSALKVIVSGRASKADLVALDPSWRGTELVLGDLAPPDAATLLVARGVDAGDAELLASRFGGNPLVLRLLANFRRDNPEVAVKELVSGERRKGRGPDWRMAYVYSRILEHVRDKEVGRLAQPGLVLRRVNPKLIMNVLARPCGLGVVNEVRARDLFDRLARHVWLVERRASDPDSVYHRRDLRRLMLPVVTVEQRKKVDSIHRAASRFYRHEARGGPDGPTGAKRTPQAVLAAEVEALYHELMLGRKLLPPIAVSRATEFRGIVGTDIEDLPELARATIKGKSGAILTPEEIRSLPVDERIEPVERQLEHHTDPHAAVAFASNALGRRWKSLLRPSQAIQLLHSTADLAALAGFGGFLRNPTALVEAISLGQHAAEVVDSSLWRVAVFRHLKGDRLSIRRVKSRPDTLDELALRESLQLLASPTPTRTPPLPDTLGIRDGVDFGAMLRLTSSRPAGTIVLRHAMLLGRPTTASLRLSKLPLLDPRIARSFDRCFPKDKTWFAGIEREELMRQLAFLADRRNAATLQLKMVDDAINRWVDARVVLGASHAAAEMLLRGLNPEFQTPAATALFDIIVDPRSARALARAAWRVSPVHPVELHPDRLAPALLEGHRSWLNQFVDIIDRAGRLGMLLDAAVTIAPRSSRLVDVAKSFQRWDQQLRTAWRRGARTPA